MRLLIALVAVTVASPAVARAIPRFAARNGNECIQCHISPSGGGIRNSYGRNVFERMWLPLGRRPAEQDWVVKPADPAAATTDDSDHVLFDPEINEWLTLGGDVRAAYFLIKPQAGVTPDAKPEATSTFFLMQADLYHAMTLNRHVTVVVDIGAYSGFEAWGLYHLKVQPETYDLMVRVGRFMPAFGIREVEHQLFTREGIGLGATDRDTGVEVTGFAGPVTAALSVLNGTLGETALDTHGTTRGSFEKAIVARLSARADLGWIRGQLGGSLYFNQDTNQANPLVAASVPSALASEVGRGVNETRAGGFATANLGRFTYLADLVWVRDNFYSDRLPNLRGYASYQELSFLPRQGVDLIATFEFADPDVEIADNAVIRAGFAVEFFPWPFTELRAMVRRTWNDASAARSGWDVVVFSHLFM